MDVALHIANLLLEHEEVSIPYLGRLIKKATPAYYNPDDNTFYPPGRRLVFDTTILPNQLLLNHIRKEENVSEEIADYYIGRFADGIRMVLATAGVVEIERLGKLRKENDTYSFTTHLELGDGLPEAYGLPPVRELERAAKPEISTAVPEQEQETGSNEQQESIPEQEPEHPHHSPGKEPEQQPTAITPTDLTDPSLQDEKPEIIQEDEPKADVVSAEPITGPTFTPVANTATVVDHEQQPEPVTEESVINPVIAQPELIEEQPKKTSIGKKLLLALLIILFVGISTTYVFFPGKLSATWNEPILLATQKQQQSAKPPALPNKVTDAIKKGTPVTTPETSIKATDTTAKDSVLIPAVTAPPADNVDIPEVTYELIGMALARNQRKDAEEYMAKMKAKGFDAKILKNAPGPMLKISLASFTTKAAAEAEKKKIQNEIKEVWILKLRNN